jgi:predicted membrane protein
MKMDISNNEIQPNIVNKLYIEEHQQEVQRKLPVAIKFHIIVFSFLMGLQFISGLLVDIDEFGETSFLTDILIIKIIVWTIIVGVFFGLYIQLFRRKNWARITIGLLTVPLGLVLLLSEEARLYCLKSSGENG